MRRFGFLTIIILAFTALGVSNCSFSTEEETDMSKKLEVGATAPPFSLPGSDGNTYSLNDFLGKRAVVIAWFPKAFTGG